MADVDLSVLRRISDRLELEPLPPRSDSGQPSPQELHAPSLSIMWGQRLNEKRDTMALVTRGSDSDSGLPRQLQALVITSKRRRPRETVDWEEFSQRLKSHILHRESASLAGAFRVFESIAEKYLDIVKRLGGRYETRTIFTAPFTRYRPPVVQSIELSDLIESAAPDTDTASLKEMFLFLTRLCEIALRAGSPGYFDEVMGRFFRFYSLGSQWEKLGAEVRKMVPDYFRTVSETVLGLRLYEMGESAKAVEELEPFVKFYLKATLATAIASAERRDVDTWKTTLDYMNTVLESTISKSVRHEYDSELATLEFHRQTSAPPSILKEQETKVAFLKACLRVRDRCKLCTLVAGAWVVNLVRAGRMDADVAKELIREVRRYLGSLTEIFEVYLFRTAENHGKKSADSDLGYKHWSLDRPVSGRVQSFWGNPADQWIKPFWSCLALMKTAQETTVPDPARIRPLYPALQTEASKQLKSEIESFMASSSSYAWLLGNTDLPKGKATLFQLIDGFVEKQERRWREELAERSLSAEKLNHFKKTCFEGYEKKRGFAKFIRHFGEGANHEPGCGSEPAGPAFVQLEDKNLFVEGPYYGSLGGEGVGWRLAKTESVLHSGRLEEQLQSVGTVSSFEELPGTIREAAAKLKTQSFAPDIVLVPPDDRFHRALTDVPHWQRKPPAKFEPSPEWVCELDGMQVYAWSHADAKSIAVLDLRHFCKVHDGKHFKGSPLKFDFREPTDQQIQEWLSADIPTTEKQRREENLKSCGNDVNLLRRTKVIVDVVADAYIGIGEPSAGAKLEIAPQTMGFVFADGGGVFHRLDCPDAKNIQESSRRYCETSWIAIYVEHLGPCDTCQPNLSAFWGR